MTHTLNFSLAGLVLLMLAACGTPKPGPISESTAPKDIQTAKSPSVTGQHQIIVTYVDAKSRDIDTIVELAEKRASERCKEHSVVRETRRTGEEATSRMMRIAGPWVELNIQCLTVLKNQLKSSGAAFVEDASRKLPDAAFFDIHGEVLPAKRDIVFDAVVRVLTAQGHPPFHPDRTRDLIMTGRVRQGVIGFPTYEQFVVAVERVSDSTTRVTFRLLSHWPDFKVSQRDPPLRPSDRRHVHKRAGEFMEGLQREVGTGR